MSWKLNTNMMLLQKLKEFCCKKEENFAAIAECLNRLGVARGTNNWSCRWSKWTTDENKSDQWDGQNGSDDQR